MRDVEERPVTELLDRARKGDEEAFDELLPLVYGVLRRVSRRELRRAGGEQTLSTTGLIHEAYLKLSPGAGVDWEGRGHFFRVAARAMRQVLVDRARRREVAGKADARAGITLSGEELSFHLKWAELLDLDGALDRLEAASRRLHQVVELRFFGGLTEREVAGALGVSTRTVRRDWTKARLFLLREMRPEGGVP